MIQRKNGIARKITPTVFVFPFEEFSFWKASGSDAFKEGASGKRPEFVTCKLSVKTYAARIWWRLGLWWRDMTAALMHQARLRHSKQMH